MIRIDTAGINEVSTALKSLAGAMVSSELMGQLGQFAMTKIKARTMEGKDAEGRAFVPYSEDYKFFRAEKGHPTNKVNLFFNGQMLASMDTKTVGDDEVVIYFADSQQAAKAHGHNFGCAKTGLPQREFFALSSDDLEEMQSMVSAHINQEAGRYGL